MPKVVPEYKEIAKNKIIQAATKVFSEKGYHGSTMDEIAREVGVSKAALYTYFKSKEDILKVIGILLNQTLIDIQKSSEGRDYLEVLEEVYKMMSESKGLSLSFEMTALSSYNENIKKLNNVAYNEKLEGLKTFLQDQQNKEKIRDDLEADILAHILTGLYTDAATQLLVGIDKSKVHETWKRSVVAILEK
jgi:AcrR family transcriptional regulator